MGLHTEPAWDDHTPAPGLAFRELPPFFDFHGSQWESESRASHSSVSSVASVSRASVSSVLSEVSESLSISGGTATVVIPTTVTEDSTTYVTSTSVLTTVLPANPSSGSVPDTETASNTSDPSSTFSSSSSGPSDSIIPIPSAVSGAFSQPLCIGEGLDTQSLGVITSLVSGGGLGILVWLIFALLRPNVRSVYSLREWFVPPANRPPPLSNGLFAFLNPPVPLVPVIPDELEEDQDAPEGSLSSQQRQGQQGQQQQGQQQEDRDSSTTCPSDEQLAQRSLFTVFLIVLGWTLISLLICLPLYMVNTPCIANTGPETTYGGRYGALADLSMLRLLRMLDEGTYNTEQPSPPPSLLSRGLNTTYFPADEPKQLQKRLIVNGRKYSDNALRRLIITCVITVVLAVLPALWKLWKEFNLIAQYHHFWNYTRCEGIEMGYLSTGDSDSRWKGNKGGAWGWRGWSEGQVKAFFRKHGLGSGPGIGEGPKTKPTSAIDQLLKSKSQKDRDSPGSEEKAKAEVNVTGVFTVGDVTRLSELIDERDVILDKLEMAEALYITSFQPADPTPSPSLRSDAVLPSVREKEARQRALSMASISSDPNREMKSKIGRPQALKGSYARNKKHRYTPVSTHAVDSPTSAHDSSPGHALSQTGASSGYLAPSQYYKLRGVQGVSGGKFAESDEVITSPTERMKQPTLSGANTGSRFQEINRDSTHGGTALPIGSRVAVNEQGELISKRGPNHGAQHHDGEERGFVQAEDGLEDEEDKDLFWVIDHDVSRIPEDEVAQTRTVTRNGRQTIFTTQTFTIKSKKKVSESTADQELPPHERPSKQQLFHRPITGLNHEELSAIYAEIRHWRSALKVINGEIAAEQEAGFEDISEGRNIKGWILIGAGVRFLPGIQMIEGRSKEDIRWEELQEQGGLWRDIVFWTIIGFIGTVLAAGLLAVAGIATVTQPDVVHYLPFLEPVATQDNLGSAIATSLAPALVAIIFIWLAVTAIHKATRYSGAVSVTQARLRAFKGTFWVLVIVAGFWFVTVAALISAAKAFDDGVREAQTAGDGAIAMTSFLLVISMNIAILAPGLMLLQPVRLWHWYRRQRMARTPRQLFRAMYPKSYNPAYGFGTAILGVIFASSFSTIFPLMGLPVAILALLTLVAHRFLVGYVFSRTDASQTGGVLQLWVLRRFATLTALQPLIIGLVLLARDLWIMGGIMIGFAVAVVILIEGYCSWRMRRPGRDSLSPITRDALEAYEHSARPRVPITNSTAGEKASTAGGGSSERRKKARGRDANGSISSVLDMMSITLAVMPSSSRNRGPVPLQTEHLDDLIATERAARTHPDAPPHLPPLAFVDAAQEMAGILYPPELTAPAPTIWLPNDSAGVARSEAYDLQHYHRLTVTIDVRTPADVQRQQASVPKSKARTP